MTNDLRFPNRIAGASDAGNHEFMEAYRELQSFSDRYMSEMTTKGLYPTDYPWPIDNLRDWSRWWEYTFAWCHLKHLFRTQRKISVLDIGSALTFFPVFLASRGAKVVSVDIDHQMGVWGEKAGQRLEVISRSKNNLHHVTGDVRRLPLADSSFDVVTNISVVEHLAEKLPAIEEIYRILKPQGWLVNTTDISLDGLSIGDSVPLDVNEFNSFHSLLQQVFQTQIEVGFTHPRDVLTPANHPRQITEAAVYVPSRGGPGATQLILYLWHRYLRRTVKLAQSRIVTLPYWMTPYRLLQFWFNPRRLEMWTVMGMTVQKSSIKR